MKTLASGNSVPLEGEVVTFQIEVTNDGTAQATGISLIDLLPAGLTATGGNGVVSQGTYNAATGLFDIGTLNIGETATLTLEGTVDVGQGGNTITTSQQRLLATNQIRQLLAMIWTNPLSLTPTQTWSLRRHCFLAMQHQLKVIRLPTSSQ